MGTRKAERTHLDRHGKIKETYETVEAAQEQADYLNQWKQRQWHHPTEAYECEVCDLYHVGGRRYENYITRKQTQMIELGERAYRELVFENRQGRRGHQRSYKRILGRYYKGNPELLKRVYTE